MAERFNAGSTGQITATIRDQAGVVVPLSAIDSATLTLRDVETGTILNSRSAQDVKNANNVTIHSTSGLLTWAVQAADNVLQRQRLQVERHEAVFRVTAGTAILRDIIREIEVVNLGPV